MAIPPRVSSEDSHDPELQLGPEGRDRLTVAAGRGGSRRQLSKQHRCRPPAQDPQHRRGPGASRAALQERRVAARSQHPARQGQGEGCPAWHSRRTTRRAPPAAAPDPGRRPAAGWVGIILPRLANCFSPAGRALGELLPGDPAERLPAWWARRVSENPPPRPGWAAPPAAASLVASPAQGAVLGAGRASHASCRSSRDQQQNRPGAAALHPAASPAAASAPDAQHRQEQGWGPHRPAPARTALVQGKIAAPAAAVRCARDGHGQGLPPHPSGWPQQGQPSRLRWVSRMVTMNRLPEGVGHQQHQVVLVVGAEQIDGQHRSR